MIHRVNNCPSCGAGPYTDQAVCPRCGERLGSDASRRTPEPDVELVPVFRSGDEARIVIAKSLLDAEGIKFLVRGDGLQDLFGWRRLGAGFNQITGPVEFVVRKDDEERTRELLRELLS